MKKTIKDREAEFIKLCEPYIKEYGISLVKEFVEYWTEIGVSDKKMRFEKEKTFGIKRRLSTWAKNDKNWNPPKEENKKPELQVYQKPKPKNEDVNRYSDMLKHIEYHKQKFFETGKFEETGAYKYYDWLYANGYIQEKIKNISEYKRKVYESIKRLSLETLKFEFPTSANENVKRKNRIQNIELDLDEKIIIEAKEAILKEYYKL